MALSEIQARLAAILAAEEASSVDWPTVDRLCDELDRELDGSGEDVPEIVAHFCPTATDALAMFVMVTLSAKLFGPIWRLVTTSMA